MPVIELIQSLLSAGPVPYVGVFSEAGLSEFHRCGASFCGLLFRDGGLELVGKFENKTFLLIASKFDIRPIGGLIPVLILILLPLLGADEAENLYLRLRRLSDRRERDLLVADFIQSLIRGWHD